MQDAILALSGNLWLPTLQGIYAAASLGTAAVLAPSPPPQARSPPPPPVGEALLSAQLQLAGHHCTLQPPGGSIWLCMQLLDRTFLLVK